METVTTSSEILPDGTAIELVASPDGADLLLLLWDGKRVTIRPEIQHAGRLYRPTALHASVRRAIWLPTRVEDYGSARALFQEVADLFPYYCGFSAGEASLLTYWDWADWFGDRLPSLPPLAVSGPDLGQAIDFFRLLRCVSRRGLILAEITRAAFGSLPMELRPTLMVAQPDLPRPLWALACASGYRGTFLPGKSGAVLDAACPKVFFTGTNGTSRWSHQTFHVALPPASSNLPRLDDVEQQRISEKFQPRLLMYRLAHLQKVRECRFASNQEKSAPVEPARNLMLCLPDDPELTQGLASVLEAQEQDRARWRSCDPNVAVVEVLWSHLQDPQGEIPVSQLTVSTNALLHSRGERLTFSPEEIGWKLRQMGIRRPKERGGKIVLFSRETSLRVHALARNFGLNLEPHGNACPDCANAPVVDG